MTNFTVIQRWVDIGPKYMCESTLLRFSNPGPIDILRLNASLALADVGLCPSIGSKVSKCLMKIQIQVYFLILIDSIWMKPLVSVGSNPPSSSMDDWCSSYRPCIPVISEGIRFDRTEVAYLGTFSAFDDDISLVKFQPDKAVDSPLAGGDGAGDELPLRGKEVAIVKDFTEFDG